MSFPRDLRLGNAPGGSAPLRSLSSRPRVPPDLPRLSEACVPVASRYVASLKATGCAAGRGVGPLGTTGLRLCRPRR